MENVSQFQQYATFISSCFFPVCFITTVNRLQVPGYILTRKNLIFYETLCNVGGSIRRDFFDFWWGCIFVNFVTDRIGTVQIANSQVDKVRVRLEDCISPSFTMNVQSSSLKEVGCRKYMQTISQSAYDIPKQIRRSTNVYLTIFDYLDGGVKNYSW